MGNTSQNDWLESSINQLSNWMEVKEQKMKAINIWPTNCWKNGIGAVYDRERNCEWMKWSGHLPKKKMWCKSHRLFRYRSSREFRGSISRRNPIHNGPVLVYPWNERHAVPELNYVECLPMDLEFRMTSQPGPPNQETGILCWCRIGKYLFGLFDPVNPYFLWRAWRNWDPPSPLRRFSDHSCPWRNLWISVKVPCAVCV
jgi:hypothetical protein